MLLLCFAWTYRSRIQLENQRVSLHGGPVGYDAVPWTVLETAGQLKLFSDTEIARLSEPAAQSSQAIFRLESKDGDQGFPGKLLIEVVIALVSPGVGAGEISANEHYDLGSIVIIYRAKLAEGDKKVVTPVNLTQVSTVFFLGARIISMAG